MQDRFAPIRPLWCFLWLTAALLAGRSAEAATIQTNDGRTLEGDVWLSNGELLIRPQGQHEFKLPLADVKQATIRPMETPAAPPPPAPASDDPPPNDGELHGLKGEYYAGQNLNDQKLLRLDRKIDFEWPVGVKPDAEVPQAFTARWTGQIKPLFSDIYTFQIEADDGARMWISGQQLFDHFNASVGTFEGKIKLEAGRKYDLKVEFRNKTESAWARLFWQSKQQQRQIVPGRCLYPPADLSAPLVRITAPAQGARLPQQPIVPIEAQIIGASPIEKMRFYADDRLIEIVQQPPWHCEWRVYTPGLHRLSALATTRQGLVVGCEPINVCIFDKPGASLPAPWLETPVGRSEPMGSAAFTGGTFTLEGHDGDLWDEDNDCLQFVFQPLRDDGSIVARLRSFAPPPNQTGSAAGLVMREHLRGGRTRIAFLGALGDGGIHFVRRENTWEDRHSTADDSRPPRWLKLSREGPIVKAYVSDNGKTWSLLGERQFSWPREVLIGLAIACPGEQSGKAVFDNVAVERGAAPIQTSFRGVVLRSGSVLVGNIEAMDDTRLKMGWWHGDSVSIPTTHVARLLFGPLSSELLGRVPPGHSGVILNSGDFIEGAPGYRDGQVSVDSVLFGTRRFSVWGDAVAAILRDLSPAPCAYEVRLPDGSLLRARSIEVDKDRLRVLEVSETAIRLPLGEVQSIARTAGRAAQP